MLNLKKNDSVIFIDLTDNKVTAGKVVSFEKNLVEIEYKKNNEVRRCKQFRNQVSRNLRKKEK